MVHLSAVRVVHDGSNPFHKHSLERQAGQGGGYDLLASTAEALSFLPRLSAGQLLFCWLCQPPGFCVLAFVFS